MKKFYIFALCFFVVFCCGCKSNETASASALDLIVTQELEQIENIDTFDDETIKALSVVIRTKHKNLETKPKENYKPKNQKILKLVKMSKNDVLKNEHQTPTFEESKTWKKVF